MTNKGICQGGSHLDRGDDQLLIKRESAVHPVKGGSGLLTPKKKPNLDPGLVINY